MFSSKQLMRILIILRKKFSILIVPQILVTNLQGIVEQQEERINNQILWVEQLITHGKKEKDIRTHQISQGLRIGGDQSQLENNYQRIELY